VALLLAEALRERGHEMLFAAPESDSLERFGEAGFAAYPMAIRSRLPVAGIRALAGLMRAEGVQVAHCHSRRAGIVGLPAARLARVPAKVLHVHSLATAAGSKCVSRLAFQSLRLLADRVIYCSEATRESTGAGAHRRAVVIPNGIDLCFPPRQVRESAPLVLSVGRLAEAKGYRTLLEAVPLVASEMPAVRFEVAGDGELREELLALRAQLGLGDRLTFLGFVDDVRPLLARASVFVMPSTREGHPLALLEATAAGVPAVATAVGEIPFVLGEGERGTLVPAGSPEALAEGILHALRRPEEARRRAEAARAWVHQGYSVHAMAGAIERLYRELLGTPP
jgi:glycosyltransferase involved in cell wall biosynthesis